MPSVPVAHMANASNRTTRRLSLRRAAETVRAIHLAFELLAEDPFEPDCDRDQRVEVDPRLDSLAVRGGRRDPRWRCCPSRGGRTDNRRFRRATRRGESRRPRALPARSRIPCCACCAGARRRESRASRHRRRGLRPGAERQRRSCRRGGSRRAQHRRPDRRCARPARDRSSPRTGTRKPCSASRSTRYRPPAPAR